MSVSVEIEQTDDGGNLVTFKDSSVYAINRRRTAVFSKREHGKMLRETAKHLFIDLTESTVNEFLAKEGKVDE